MNNSVQSISTSEEAGTMSKWPAVLLFLWIANIAGFFVYLVRYGMPGY